MRAPALALLAALATTGALLSLAAPAAVAAEWYWRPAAGGPYGAGDGRSHASAWHRGDRIDWAAMAAGDTLWVCGLHDGGGVDGVLEVGAAGAPGRPLRISGECPGDPGAILAGAGPWRPADWQGPDAHGAYSRPHKGRSGQMLDEEGFVPRRDGPPDARWPCRSWSQVGDVAYYKPCGAPRTVHADGRSPVVRVTRRDHVQVDGLRVANANRLVEVTDSAGFRLLRTDLQYAANAAVLVVGTSPDGLIGGNHIRDAGYGVYFVNPGKGGSGTHDGWLVEGNHIHDVYGTPDAHCIGWQAGSRNVIRKNDLHDCEGSAITFYDPGRGARVSDNVIEDNVIREVRDRGRGGVNQRGIEVNGHNCPRNPDNSTGNVIRNNTITGVDHDGIWLKTGRPTRAGVYSWTVTGNTVRDVENGLQWLDGSWYGEPQPGRPDPCDRANRIPALSAPGFLFAGNTIGGVRSHFVFPKALGVALQSDDYSGIELRDNRYEGRGRFTWQARGARCRGREDASLNRCTTADLEGFQLASGKDRGSVQLPAP